MLKRVLSCRSWLALVLLPVSVFPQTSGPVAARSSLVRISFHCGDGCLWQYSPADDAVAYRFAPPAFEIEGRTIVAQPANLVAEGAPIHLINGVTETRFKGFLGGDSHLALAIQFQVNDQTAAVRFRYTLEAGRAVRLTGANRLSYLATSLKTLPRVEEVSLANFVDLTHSYTLAERPIGPRYFADGMTFMGPILAATDGRRSMLLAYEHGSQVPDAFLHFVLSPDRTVRLAAVKGNYAPGQIVDATHPYATVWLETAAVAGDLDQLAATYRRFVLGSMSENPATRTPYIFYNTWNFQERNKWWNHRPYLESMNQDRILDEIVAAHAMGVDVFVLDTGWFEKTGDWTVSTKRFPNGLRDVKAKLDGYGMKLGLWLSPTLAAISSHVVSEHPEWRMSWNGVIPPPREVWETEKSYGMCLVSGYADSFADQLIRIAKEVGVSYFKWDAVHQYGCNDPHHNHGTDANTPQERGDSYAFQLVQAMSHVADKVAAAAPGTIVDFDVTEGGRAMGLAFLASGKFFLINNGPYKANYDQQKVPNTNDNLFFYQGPARTWIARSPLTFDKWIPSILFLSHYFPDDPKQWQEVDVASLILGQNGIWGDLPSVSPEGVGFIGGLLARYKQVREDITASDPVVTGLVSASPEIHEKISAATGRGAVVIFAGQPGKYEYITEHKAVAEHWASDGVTLEYDSAGHAKIAARFDKPGAKIIFFGTR